MFRDTHTSKIRCSDQGGRDGLTAPDCTALHARKLNSFEMGFTFQSHAAGWYHCCGECYILGRGCPRKEWALRVSLKSDAAWEDACTREVAGDERWRWLAYASAGVMKHGSNNASSGAHIHYSPENNIAVNLTTPKQLYQKSTTEFWQLTSPKVWIRINSNNFSPWRSWGFCMKEPRTGSV